MMDATHKLVETMHCYVTKKNIILYSQDMGKVPARRFLFSFIYFFYYYFFLNVHEKKSPMTALYHIIQSSRHYLR